MKRFRITCNDCLALAREVDDLSKRVTAEMVAREREERVWREEFKHRLECQRESFQLRAALTEALSYAERLREAVESYTEYTDYNGRAWCSACLTEWSTDVDEPAHTNDCLASTSHIEKLKGALE